MYNSKFAHRSTEKDIENFYKIMSGEKKIRTKRDEYEFEAGYFALCLLLPKKLFLDMIEVLGGMELVKTDKERKECLARAFNVEYRLVEIRINDLLLREQKQSNSKSLKM